MTKIALSSHSRKDLEASLLVLKSYRNGLKQIGRRATLLDKNTPPSPEVVLEYAPGMEEKSAHEIATRYLTKVFPEYSGSITASRVNPELVGGIRLLALGDVLDISFSKAETLLKL